jgi:hypothetical protein
MSESAYRLIIEDYLNHQLTVNEFIDSFMKQWKQDRENESFDPRFRQLIDRLFTSCDCYDEEPEEEFEISETELKNEVRLLRSIWWEQAH